MNRIRLYLKDQLSVFNKESMWSPIILKEGAKIVGWWAIPAFLSVWIVAHYRQHLPASYLECAINEGIGPHLWNVIGTLGLIFVGIALVFPESRFIAQSAHQILINTYAIGGLSFGLIFGQLTTSIASANIEKWKIWLMSAGAVALAIQVIFLNFSLWYLGHLMSSRQKDDGFMHRVTKVHLRIRLIAASIIIVVPISVIMQM